MANFHRSFDGVEETETHARQELTIEENQCVVCGRSDTHHRKNIVPLEYQNYFPREKKLNSWSNQFTTSFISNFHS